MLNTKRVENPKYQTMNEIANDYWDNWLIISNRTDDPRGGIVLYCCQNRTEEMHAILAKLDEDPETNGYPDFVYVGPSRGFIGGIQV